MSRSLVLGGLALLAGLSLVAVWTAIGDVESAETPSVARASQASIPTGDAAPELVDPLASWSKSAAEPLPDPASIDRAPVAPRIVDASERATGVDLHGSIQVVGGARENLPPTKLVFRRGGFPEETIAIGAEYLMPRLAPGKWIVSAEQLGYENLSQEIDLVPEPREQRIDFTMTRLPHIFVNMITPQGQPFMKALRTASGSVARMNIVVVATMSPPRDRLGATLEDGYEEYGLGKWRPSSGWKTEAEVDEPRAGILELPRPLPVYVSVCVENVVLTTQFAPSGTEQMEFVLTPEDVRATRGSLRLRIADAETGRPVTEGRVGLHANGNFGMGDPIIQQDGTVEFADLPPGPRHLSVVCRGYEWVVEQVWIDAGLETNLGVLRLNRPISIAGTAVDEDGDPVRAWISVWPLERYEASQRIADKFCWYADHDGQFKIQPAGRRRYLLRANDEEWASESAIVDASDGPVENVRLKVARGVTLTVDFGAEVQRGSRLLVHDMHGHPVGERPVLPGGCARIGVHPGRYRVRMEFDGEPHEDRMVDVGTEPVLIAMGR
ncbi:MAG: hypothetical protein ACKVXR_01285 [Planctomycetota bacterium]